MEHTTDTHQSVLHTSERMHASQGRKIPRGENLFLSLVSDVVASSTGNGTSILSEKSISEKIHLKIIRYLSEALAELDYKMPINCLQWWKSKVSFSSKAGTKIFVNSSYISSIGACI